MTAVAVVAVAAMALVGAAMFWLGRRTVPPRPGAGLGTVRPERNAAAMSGQYVCAAMFMGIAGAVVAGGIDAVWFPIGVTAGFLALMIFVAAPLRRSGAYTVPDFIDARLGGDGIRRLASLVMLLIALLYLVPQFRGAQLVVGALIGGPGWTAPVVTTAFVLVIVVFGGMRSVTVAQAFAYWVKLVVIVALTVVVVVALIGSGVRAPASVDVGRHLSMFDTYSLLVALVLGAMGLPHLLMRFYTDRDGRAARRTSVHVLRLVGLFVVFPLVLGVLARWSGGRVSGDAAVVVLPMRVVPGFVGQALTVVAAAGAFAAFAVAACALVFGVAGVVSRDLIPVPTPAAAAVVALAALAMTLWLPPMSLTDGVAAAFALAAATFCPVLVLGIWWRRLTAAGAAAALTVGAAIVVAADVVTVVWGAGAPAVARYPALAAVPAAFAAAVIVSAATRRTVPSTVAASMLRMHAPDDLGLLLDDGRASGDAV